MNTSGGSILTMQPTNSQMMIGNLNNNSNSNNIMIVENHSPSHIEPSRSPSMSSMNYNSGGNSSPSHSQNNHNSNEESDDKKFMASLYKFMESRGTPIEKIPIFDHKELNLYKLYNCVISRGGLESVIENKLWRQITNDLSVDPERTDAGFRLRIHYLKFLYPYERKHFLKSDDENFDFDLFEKNLSKSPADKKILNRKKKLQQQLTLNPPHHHHNNHHNSNNHSILLNLNSQQHFNSPSSGKSTPENSSPNSLLSSNINLLNNTNNSTSNMNRDDFMNNNSNSNNSNINNNTSNNINNNLNAMGESSFLYNSSILSSPLSPSNIQNTTNNNTSNGNNSQFNNILNSVNNNVNNNNVNNNSNPVNNILSISPISSSFYSGINTSSNFGNTPSVNLNHLEFKSLKKYNHYHKLKVSNTPSKKELYTAVLQHFSQHKIDEEGIINSFLKRIKSETRIRPVSSI